MEQCNINDVEREILSQMFPFVKLICIFKSYLMRVHLLKKQSIEDYIAINNQSRIPLKQWLSKVKRADWEKPSDMILTFNDADLLGKSSKRIVFNICF